MLRRIVRLSLIALLFAAGVNNHTFAKSDTLDALNAQASSLYQQGRYSEGIPIALRALAIAERLHDSDQTALISAATNLAMLYQAAGRYADAEPLFKRALATGEKLLGSKNPNVGALVNNLAELYRNEGRFAEAEPLYRRALAIWEKASGRDSPDVATALNNLSLLYEAEGRYAETEPLYKRALAISEKTLGPNHPDVARVLNNLGELYRTLGRYAEAEPLYRRSLDIREKTLGPNHPSVATALNNLGLLEAARTRYADAEPLFRRAIQIWEGSLGPEHPYVATGLHNLAQIYRDQGRFAQAEPLFKRALAIREKALGADHPYVGDTLNDLAMLYHMEDRLADAEPLHKRALAIRQKTLGANHPDVAASLNNLAELYRDQGLLREAEPLYRRALGIWEKSLGPNSPEIATLLNNVALLKDAEARPADAEVLFKRALAIRQKVLGPDHAQTGEVLDNLAWLALEGSKWSQAVYYGRQSTSITIQRTRRGGAIIGRRLTGKTKSDAERNIHRFGGLIKAAYRLSKGDTSGPTAREMFTTAQWMHASEAAASLADMAARTAASDDALARLVRERQDLVDEWRTNDETVTAARSASPSDRNAATEEAVTSRLSAIDARLAEIDAKLEADFPNYSAFSNPGPASVEDTQAVLRPDEVMIVFLDTPEFASTPEESFIWVVTKSEMRWVRIDLGSRALSEGVAALRCGLDVEAWTDQRCPQLLKVSYTAADRYEGKLPPFDLVRAHQLYRALLGPVEDLIKDKRLLVVPSGPLTTLPLQVLVTEAPRSPDYAAASWLGARQSITVLPSVASLQTLRKFAKASHAAEPFIGFGDPLLDGDPAVEGDPARANEAREKQHCRDVGDQQVASISTAGGGTRALAVAAKGLADVDFLRRQLPLPETADELCAVARDFGVDPETHVYLGARATEAELKRLSREGMLARYQIVHFATHGAIAGELSASSEPGLILTPPNKASELDDGYLSASEIAALKLDADWVILSACNTAAGDAKEADALSGLARAFFYAGARSLLVSHWEVASESTVKLITEMATELKADSQIGRAEALRRSMLSLITKGKTYEAHPAFWAPFVLVGEGGASR
jgi:CHAT domain-containing protein/tetratricopeptide (TPR) repeat protein